MAPVTRRRGNRYAILHDAYECAESVHEELEATPERHEEDLQVVLRVQIADLTQKLAELRLYDIRQRRRTPPWREEEEDESDDSYGSANPFVEPIIRGGQLHQIENLGLKL
jgi:hypothetical protein